MRNKMTKLEIVVLAKGKAKKRTFNLWDSEMLGFITNELTKDSVREIKIKKV